MIEIKVGDRCSVRGYCKRLGNFNSDFIYFDDDRYTDFGIATIESVLALGRLELRFKKKPEYIFVTHRWQCRKLVKVRKCDRCKGIGECDDVHIRLDRQYIAKIICDECNGSGKVKK